MPESTSERRERRRRPPRGETPPTASNDEPRTANGATPDPEPEVMNEPSPMLRASDMTAAEKKLAEAVAQMYQMIGGITVGIGIRLGDAGLAGTGAKTLEMSEPISVAWIDLSRRSPAVKRWLQRTTEMGATSVLVGMHVAALIPLLIDRGVIPPTIVSAFGAEPTPAGFNGNGNPAA